MRCIGYWVCGAIATSVGCATAPPPLAELQSVQSSLELAVEAGAETNETAALHLRLARESLAAANRYASERMPARAHSMARRAEADAALAAVLARACIATGEAEAARSAERTAEQESAGALGEETP